MVSSSILDSSGDSVEKGSDVTTTIPSTLRVDVVLKQLKYHMNFKKNFTFGFEINELGNTVERRVSYELDVLYECFNVSKGTTRLFLNLRVDRIGVIVCEIACEI